MRRFSLEKVVKFGVFYQLRSMFGEKITINRINKNLTREGGRGIVSSQAYFYQPFGVEDFIFFLSGSMAVYCPGYEWEGYIKPFRLKRLDNSNRITLEEPVSTMFLTAEGEGGLSCRRHLGSATEEVVFELGASDEPNRSILAQAHALEALPKSWGQPKKSHKRPPWGKNWLFGGVVNNKQSEVTQPIQNFDRSAIELVQIIKSRQISRDVAQALSRMLTVEELAKLADLYMQNEYFRTAVNDLYRGDLWVTEALPGLLRLMDSNESSAVYKIEAGTNFDSLEAAGLEGRQRTMPMAFNTLSRAQVTPRKRFGVLATARNEGLYIIDWIAHHKAQGFEDFFIYTNDNEDGSDDLLEILANNNVIRLIRNYVGTGVGPQYKAYGHALQILPDVLDYEWLAVIDLDEFISFDSAEHDSVGSFIDGMVAYCHGGVDSVSLNWRVYPPNGELHWRDLPVWDRFPISIGYVDDHVKSIFRPRFFQHSHCHYPFSSEFGKQKYVDANWRSVEPGPFNPMGDYSRAWVDHYYFKSPEEYMVRRIRSRGDRPVSNSVRHDMISTDLIVGYLQAFGIPTDPSCAPNGQSLVRNRACIEVDCMLAIPGIADALKNCKKLFKAQVSDLIELMESSDRFHVAGSPESEILSMIRNNHH